MSTSSENITFMIVRGVVALAIVGLGFYCIAQGIHFFSLPRVEAEQIHVNVLGLDITANGLGAVIFGAGIALAFVGMRTAPRRIDTHKTTEFPPAPPAPPPPADPPRRAAADPGGVTGHVPPITNPGPGQSWAPGRVSEGTTIMEGTHTPTVRLD